MAEGEQEPVRTRRNIVIFCDGTWNSPEDEQFGQPTPTNVHKLYRASLNEAESEGRQITWYEPGVGSEGSTLRRALEGATGLGIGANIRRGYAAIAAHYRGPEDRIFLIGFSRGAFAARSIAGMIQKVGLLRSPARRAVEAAYEAYRNSRNEADPLAAGHRTLGEVHRDVRIHAVGVWDTVGALGLAMWGWSFNLRVLWRNSFHRLSPNLITDHVFQALSVDEKRTSFMPVTWHEVGDPGGVPAGVDTNRRPVVEEAWFRGVHSDVGGGYADTSLSDIALQWMAEKLRGAGLELRSGAPRVAPDPNGRVHNSARGPLWTNVATWPRWAPLRTLAEGASTRSYLHDSVRVREAEAARSGLDDMGRRRLAVGEHADVAIRARYQWEYTGLVLEPAAEYELTAHGTWQDWKDTPTGPIGQYPADESWLKRRMRWARRMPDARWMALIALPNADFGWKWRELGLGQAMRYFFVEDPPEFTRQLQLVGAHCRMVVSSAQEAMLWCFANDHWKFYGNNTGAVVLRVTRRT